MTPKNYSRAPHADPDHETAPRSPANLIDLGGVSDLVGIEVKGRPVVIAR